MMRCLLYSVFALVLAACAGSGGRGDVAFSAFSPVGAEGWRYSDTLAFAVGAPADTAPCTGDIILCVRHSDAYPYSNIWVEVMAPCDTVQAQMELADVYGRWYGRGMGLTFECSDTIARGVRLARGDTLRLRHNMRVDTLAAIEQVGVFFVKR